MFLNIDSDLLRFGAYLGFKISRLDFLWGSPFEFAQTEIEPSKKEILSLVSSDDIQIDESNSHAFIQSITDYYLRTNIEIFSSILIGSTIQKCALVGASSKPEDNIELKKLAEDTLKGIPQKIVSDKKYLFEFIYKHRKEDLFEILDLLDSLEQTSIDNMAEVKVDSSKTNYENRPTLFLSYCEKDSPIANIIESQLIYETNNCIQITRYTRVPYKESFKKFMNSIQDYDYVLCLISDNYLKSQACMYEVGEVIKNRHFKDKLLFVVLGENDCKYYRDDKNMFSAAKIYGSEINRLKYIQYWKEKYEELEAAIREIDNTVAVINSSKELAEIGKIYRNDIGEFLAYLSQYKGKSFDELLRDRFFDIIKWIFPDWKSGLFKESRNISDLLSKAIEAIWNTTQTDYNQIALSVRVSKHNNGLVVFADNINETKQRYRQVIMDGIMGASFLSGEIMNIKNVDIENRYFCAVKKTKSELVIPIKFEQTIIGVINSEAEETNYYTEEIIKKICDISQKLSLALKRIGFGSNMFDSEIPYVHIEFK